MQKDILKTTIDSIEEWCGHNSISMFYGEVNKNKLAEVHWTGEDDWKSFFNGLKSLEPKIIIIQIRRNEIDIQAEAVIVHCESLELDEKLEFKDALKVISENNGNIVQYLLYFIYNDVFYTFNQDADWVEQYSIVYEVLKAGEEIEINDESLSNEQIESFARKLLSNPKYLEAKSNSIKRQLVRDFAEKESISENGELFSIRNRADEIVETEIKPKQEEDVKRKILDLKSKGSSKVKIASKLGIGSRTVDKFFYADEN